MGTPVPILVPGDKCDVCWGPAKSFGDIDTTKFIQVEISGVEKGPDWQPGDGEPVNGIFTVTQDDILPCTYYLLFSVPMIFLLFAWGQTQLEAKNEKNVEYFMTFSAGGCPTVINNDLRFHFTGGTAKLWIPGFNL